MNISPSLFNQKDPRETVVLTFDASLQLATGETLTSAGTPQIITTVGTDGTSPALILSGVLVNATPLSVAGRTVAVGCAVQAVATVGNFASQYLIAITCPTSNPDKILTLKATLPMALQ